MIAVIGVDGSGKSAVIHGLKEKLARESVAVYVYECRHGRGKTGQGKKTWNHASPPRPVHESVAKILLRASLWCWHYQFHLKPLMAGGTLVLCDRFYFDDVLVDPLKYRYGGPAWLINRLRVVVPRPDFFILLDAPVSVLYGRKQETTIDEVHRLREAFLDLCDCGGAYYCVDASPALEHVIGAVHHIVHRKILSNHPFHQLSQG